MTVPKRSRCRSILKWGGLAACAAILVAWSFDARWNPSSFLVAAIATGLLWWPDLPRHASGPANPVVRIFKRTGISICVVILVLWAVSISRTIQYLQWNRNSLFIVESSGRNLRIQWHTQGTPAGRCKSLSGWRSIKGTRALRPFRVRMSHDGIINLPYSLAFAIWAAPTTFLWYLHGRRILPGHCQKCGYDLTGNVSGICPECGKPCEPDARAT